MKETKAELSTSNPLLNKKGKVALPLAFYKERSLARIAEITAKMETIPSHSPLWIKLRKQKLAQ